MTRARCATSTTCIELHYYDTYGRPQHQMRVIDQTEYFWYSYSYDDQGRLATLNYPATSSDATWASPGTTRLAVEQVYNANGALSQVRKAGGGATYWALQSSNALGNVTQFVQNASSPAGIVTVRYHDPATGLLLTQSSESDAASFFQIDEYEWDLRGNLTERRDKALAGSSVTLREAFDYDGLDRLTQVQVTAPSINGGAAQTYTNTYAQSGRILSRGTSNGGNYTNYTYGSARPHAVSAVTAGSASRTFSYDANGNLTAATNVVGSDARQVFWNAHNLPYDITRGEYSAAFSYGPDHQRYKQHLIEPCPPGGSSNPTTTTLYLGGLMERLVKSATGPLQEYRHYIQAGGQTIAVHTRWSNNNTRDEYLHHDHLGSVVAITNSAGALVDRLSYDPWGKRRQAAVGNAWLGLTPGSYLLPTSLASLTRGYTGHEHLDQIGLIHMNGRIYDPELGRFLSADPVVQFPESTQGLDRYAYVGNNPLSATDPSGHFIETLIAIGSAILAGTAIKAGELVAAFLIAAMGGFMSSGSLEGAIISVVSMAATLGVANFADTALQGLTSTALANVTAVLHGLAQGVIAAVQGENFGAAFLAGSLASRFGPQRTNASLGGGERAFRVLQAAAIGGTASKIGGGKFANGAISGAFVQAFNHDGPTGRDTGSEGIYPSEPKVTYELETTATYTESRFVPLMEDWSIPDLVGYDRRSKVLAALRDGANALYYSEYAVTFDDIRRIEVTTTRMHYTLRSSVDGKTYYGGYHDVSTRQVVGTYTHVRSYRHVGYSGAGKIGPSAPVVPKSCIQFGARNC